MKTSLKLKPIETGKSDKIETGNAGLGCSDRHRAKIIN
jgi:hypothetical protein